MNLNWGSPHVAIFLALSAVPAYPCEVIGPLPSASDLVRRADAIVVVRAVSYTTPVSDPKYGANGEPEPRVRFQVLDTLKSPIATELILPAFLTDVDDFNSEPPPYRGVRSYGRRGNCYADEYRQGGTFLLLLKATSAGGYTVRWAPLAPINEQVRAAGDPWVAWVRQRSR